MFLFLILYLFLFLIFVFVFDFVLFLFFIYLSGRVCGRGSRAYPANVDGDWQLQRGGPAVQHAFPYRQLHSRKRHHSHDDTRHYDNHRVPPTRRDVSRRRKEMIYLTTHSTHFIYGYMASYIW